MSNTYVRIIVVVLSFSGSCSAGINRWALASGISGTVGATGGVGWLATHLALKKAGRRGDVAKIIRLKRWQKAWQTILGLGMSSALITGGIGLYKNGMMHHVLGDVQPLTYNNMAPCQELAAISPLTADSYASMIGKVSTRAEKIIRKRTPRSWKKIVRKSRMTRDTNLSKTTPKERDSGLHIISKDWRGHSLELRMRQVFNWDHHCSFHSMAGALTGQEYLGPAFLQWLRHYLVINKKTSKFFNAFFDVDWGLGTFSYQDTGQSLANMTGRPVAIWKVHKTKGADCLFFEPEESAAVKYPLKYTIHLNAMGFTQDRSGHPSYPNSNITHLSWYNVLEFDGEPIDRVALNRQALFDRISVLGETLSKLPKDQWKDLALDIWMHLGMYVLSVGTECDLLFDSQSLAKCYEQIKQAKGGSFVEGDRIIATILSILEPYISTSEQATDLLLIRGNGASRWLELLSYGKVHKRMQQKINQLKPQPLTSRRLSWMDIFLPDQR